MNEVIEKFYKENAIPAVLLKQKIAKLNKYSDIAMEFTYWIENRAYKSNGVSVEGYTAGKLAEISPYLDGEGAFMMLIELHENPKKALSQIANGFKKK
jgi:hypothetical protein